MDSKNFLGIDLGSRTVKVCFMSGGEITEKKIFDSMEFYRKYGVRDNSGFRIDLSALGFTEPDGITATGYGRTSAAVAGAENISEIKAHFLGAVYQTGMKSFTLLDIGGQDYKVIHVRDSRMVDIATNDKCAASTGRYIENMARVLGIALEDIGQFHDNPVKLSSTCAIFGESELIGMIVRGEPMENLAAGVNLAVVERIIPLLDRMPEDVIVLAGGVSLNDAVRKFIGEVSGKEVLKLPDPVFNGALGCCAWMLEKNK